MKNKKSYWDRWRFKYKLVILNSESFEERFSLILSRLNVFLIIGAITAFLIIGTGLLIAFSPLKGYLPGYTSVSMKRQVIKLNHLSDSLSYELALNKKYLNNIRNIINGESVGEEIIVDDVEEPSFSDVSFIKNTEDSLLRVQVEEEERYNLFKRDEDNSTLPLFFKPIRGVVIDSIDHQKAHYGIDIVAKENEVVKATLDGTVIMSSWTSETGNVIAIQHSNDFISVYKHNSVLLKKEGVSVRAGEAIAIIGNSGKWSSGPHLHFELWQKGTCIDPQLYINF